MITPETRDPPVATRRPLAAGVLAVVHPVVFTFLIAAVFSYLTGDTVRAGYLGVVGLALVWDHARSRGRPPLAPGMPVERRRAVMDRLLLPAVVAGLVFAVSVGLLKRYSWPATISVTAVAAVAVLAAWVVSAGSTDPPKKLGWVGVSAWTAVLVGAAGWELTALFLQPALTTNSYAHPTLSNLMDPVLASVPGRASVLFAWLALGWYLARR
ncbi:MAG TPA: hypothetical protein VGS19_34270 [Streptosporangiaceae bacterium]|nr:hypothetical protein [Streptosporangiaceae bacterium]